MFSCCGNCHTSTTNSPNFLFVSSALFFQFASVNILVRVGSCGEISPAGSHVSHIRNSTQCDLQRSPMPQSQMPPSSDVWQAPSYSKQALRLNQHPSRKSPLRPGPECHHHHHRLLFLPQHRLRLSSAGSDSFRPISLGWPDCPDRVD